MALCSPWSIVWIWRPVLIRVSFIQNTWRGVRLRRLLLYSLIRWRNRNIRTRRISISRGWKSGRRNICMPQKRFDCDQLSATVIGLDSESSSTRHRQISSRRTKGFLCETQSRCLTLAIAGFQRRRRHNFQNVRGVEMQENSQPTVVLCQSSETRKLSGLCQWLGENYGCRAEPASEDYQSSLQGLTGKDYMNAEGIIGFNIIHKLDSNLATDATLSVMGTVRFFFFRLCRQLPLSETEYQGVDLWLSEHLCRIECHRQTGGDKLIPNTSPSPSEPQHHTWLNVGLFWSVVFSRDNHFRASISQSDHLLPYNRTIGGQPWQRHGRCRYEGPVRQVDQVVRSDNAGRANHQEYAEAKWLVGNKYGIQAGIQYYDVAGIDHLDMRLEYKYGQAIYLFRNATVLLIIHTISNHRRIPWENFYEIICQVRYAPTSRWTIEPTVCLQLPGRTMEISIMGAIFLNHTRHEPEISG